MGLNARSPDPAPQLIKLGEAKAVGIFDQNGVDAGNIQAGLDDGGADQNLRLPTAEGEHGGFQFPFLHLAVGDRNAGIGHHLPHSRRHVLDALDPGHHVKYLAPPIQLLANGGANGFPDRRGTGGF
jgi:hypothetical protein